MMMCQLQRQNTSRSDATNTVDVVVDRFEQLMTTAAQTTTKASTPSNDLSSPKSRRKRSKKTKESLTHERDANANDDDDDDDGDVAVDAPDAATTARASIDHYVGVIELLALANDGVSVFSSFFSCFMFHFLNRLTATQRRAATTPIEVDVVCR